jgi:hypothetical protein
VLHKLSGSFSTCIAWSENSDENKCGFLIPLLIDGGIRDGLGLVGLGTFSSEKKRVVNLVVGDFGFQGPGGIHSLPTERSECF